MYQPFAYMAPAAGGANLLPVGGYLAYIDFAEDSYLTFDGSGNIETATDISGNGYDATQTDAAKRPGVSSAGKSAQYYLAGNNTRRLEWSTMDAAIAATDPATNDYTIVTGIEESSQRRQPWGLGEGGAGSRRLEFFMNDSTNRRDYIAVNRQVFFSSTNDSNKDIILFGESDASNITIYGYMNSLSTGTAGASWATDAQPCYSRIGNTARGANPSDDWTGKLYFIAVYQSHLTTLERESIRDWAVAKWGMTLTT